MKGIPLPSPTLCHPVPLAHLCKIEVTEVCHLMKLSYSRLNSFTSNGLSILIFVFTVFWQSIYHPSQQNAHFFFIFQINQHLWLTITSVASIPARNVICAIAMATTRLKRIWVWSSFKSPKEAKKIIEHRWHVIFSKRENPIWRCACFFLIKNHKWTSDKLIQSLIALRGVVKRAADSPFPSLVVLLLS